MARIDYYFSLISPFTYLAGDRLERIAAARGAEIVYKPFNISQVFAETGGLPLPKRHPSRRAYRMQELRRWRDATGLPLNLEPLYFPVNAALASAHVAAAQEGAADPGPLARAFLRAVWAEERDISDRDTVAEVVRACGLDPEALLASAGGEEAALAKVAANTDEAIARGVFGSPFYIVGEEIFWGQDRLEQLDAHLAAAA